MTSTTGAGGGATGDDAVGSLAEEAARLFDALRDLGRDQGTSFAEQAEAVTSWAADGVRGLDAHVATGAPECRYCPLCRAIAFVRSTSPEARAHLADAATSLAHAASALLAPPTPPERGERGERAAGSERADRRAADGSDATDGTDGTVGGRDERSPQ